MFKIIFYQDKDGHSEVEDYLDSLINSNGKEAKQKLTKIDAYFKALREYGFSLKEPYIKKLDDKIWELRPLRDRFLFAGWVDGKFVILSHFVKKTNKTPPSEIKKAKRLLDDFIKRM